MRACIVVVAFLAACGGKSPQPKPQPPPPTSEKCTAADKLAVERGVEIETNEASPLYDTLSTDEFNCARAAVRSSAPLADDAPACLKDGRVLTAKIEAIRGGTELPAEAGRDAFAKEIGAVPLSQRPAYLLEALDRAYDCGGKDLQAGEGLWEIFGQIESSIEACKCTLDGPRLQLLAWYFHGGGGDWAATIAERSQK